jgi:hypothetical protein
MKLSDRQEFALLALDGLRAPAGGAGLAARMTANGRETSTAGAHQAANGLVNKKLAIKGYPAGIEYSRYEITNEGRKVAAALREAAS